MPENNLVLLLRAENKLCVGEYIALRKALAVWYWEFNTSPSK